MLLMVAGMFAFIIWLARGDFDRDLMSYEIFFEGSVAGLSSGSQVQFNGVPVGQVAAIEIVPDRPQLVRVVVRIDEDTPVNTDTVATLEAQGFTGLAIVQLRGGAAGEQPLTRDADANGLPRIPSERSGLQAIFENAPELLSTAITTMQRLQVLLDDTTVENIQRIFDNAAGLTGTLAARREDINRAVAELDDTLTAFRQVAEDARTLMASAQDLTDQELTTTLVQAEETLEEAEALLTGLNGVIEENREALSTFVNNALPESTRLIADLRRLTLATQRIVERFEEAPIDVIFGEPKPIVGETQ